MRPLRHAAGAALLVGAVLVCAQPAGAQALGGGSIGSRGDSIGGGQAIGAVSGTTSAAIPIPVDVCAFEAISSGSLYALGGALADCPATAPTAGTGDLTINDVDHHGYDVAIIDGNTTIAAAWGAASYFTTTADERAAILVIKGNLTVDSGEVFTPTVRKTFWLLYVTGDLVVNGEISMTARGANHSATGSDLNVNGPLRIYTGTLDLVGGGTLADADIPAAGGAGGAGVDSGNGTPGAAGSGGGMGGGGSGGVVGVNADSGDGSGGTAYTAGTGSGGNRTGATPTLAGGARGGAGSDAIAIGSGSASGGGAGNPGGAFAVGGDGVAQDGATGTAGALVVGVAGSLSGSGLATSNGGNGGSTVSGSAGNACGGGASGGGHVTIAAGSGTLTTTANAGAGGVSHNAAGTRAGGNGGIGTARIGVIP